MELHGMEKGALIVSTEQGTTAPILIAKAYLEIFLNGLDLIFPKHATVSAASQTTMLWSRALMMLGMMV